MVRMSRSHIGSRFSNVVRAHAEPGAASSQLHDGGEIGTTLRLPAGESLDRGEVVYQNPLDTRLYLASSGNLDTREILGITKAPADPGQLAEVVYRGGITNPDWSWAPGLPIYAGLNGALTQIAPPNGYRSVIGHAVSSDTVLVGVERFPRKIFTKSLAGVAVTIPTVESGITYPEVKVLTASGAAVSVAVVLSEASVQISSNVPLDNHIAVLT